MRQSPLLAVLLLAGCDVATRNANELAFLRDVEERLDAGDRCGLYRLVTVRPGMLPPDDPLAVELRSFVRASRDECLFGRVDPEEGGSSRMPDIGLVELARSEVSGARDAGDGPSAGPPGAGADGASDDGNLSPGPSPQDIGEDAPQNEAPGGSDNPEDRGGGSDGGNDGGGGDSGSGGGDDDDDGGDDGDDDDDDGGDDDGDDDDDD